MKNVNNLTVGYKTKKVKVRADDLDKGFFSTLVNRRKIMPSVVKSLYRGMLNGEHFESPLVVNVVNGEKRLIDGNHRWEAMRQFLIINNKKSIEITIHFYEDLSISEEKAAYSKWNKGRKQSTNDVIKQYEDDIPALLLLKKNSPIPITVYGGVGSLSFYKIISSYLAAKAKTWGGGYSENAFTFVEHATELGHSAVAEIRAFLTDFKGAFGPIKNNPWARTTPLVVLMKLWYDNHQKMTPVTFQRQMKRLEKDKAAENLGGLTGRNSAMHVWREYKRLLNGDRKNPLFV